MFCAGAASCAGAIKPATGGDGGPTTSPSWIAVGTRDTTGTAGATPAYGTNVSGDLFVLIVAGRITSVTTPAGWTLQIAGTDRVGRKCYMFTRDTRSTGGEAGTVSVTLTADSQVASIHTYRNVATSSFVEDPSDGGSAANGTGPLPPAITSSGAHRLAVFASGDGNQITYPASVVSTGGTWTRRDQQGTGTGNNCSYGLYDCDLAAAGTITGGDGGTTIDEHSAVGLALVGV